MRVPPIFADRAGQEVAIGKVAIPRIPDKIIRELRKKPPRSYKGSYKAPGSIMGKKEGRNAISVLYNGLDMQSNFSGGMSLNSLRAPRQPDLEN